MESKSGNPALIVILGPTASGKTSLALQLARRFNGEIIAADSRTIYKGMDIGTAKPTRAEQDEVPHHLIDVVSPDQAFTVADFQRLASEAISDIVSRGKTPFLVGGSGLYIDAVIYNFSFRGPADPGERAKLQEFSVDELQEMIAEEGLSLPENNQNPRHLIRVLETKGELPVRTTLRSNTLVLGLSPHKDILEPAIRKRVDAMIESGFVDEVKKLVDTYEQQAPALQAPGYREFSLYLAGQMDFEEAKQQFIRAHLRYAKRQKTWFKRNSDIRWISNSEEAVDLVTTFLNK